jgi:hypothetical protein
MVDGERRMVDGEWLMEDEGLQAHKFVTCHSTIINHSPADMFYAPSTISSLAMLPSPFAIIHSPLTILR